MLIMGKSNSFTNSINFYEVPVLGAVENKVKQARGLSFWD